MIENAVEVVTKREPKGDTQIGYHHVTVSLVFAARLQGSTFNLLNLSISESPFRTTKPLLDMSKAALKARAQIVVSIIICYICTASLTFSGLVAPPHSGWESCSYTSRRTGPWCPWSQVYGLLQRI